MKVYRDSLPKICNNPGGDCYWVGGRPKVNVVWVSASLIAFTGLLGSRTIKSWELQTNAGNMELFGENHEECFC